jgi:ferric-dicitrate binding protein FerR (iron transport regulator)
MKKNRITIESITRYLSNNSSNDKKMIDKIIHDDEKSRQEFDAYLNVWEKSANLKGFEMIDTEADWNKVSSRMKLRTSMHKISPQTYILRIAAILFLAAGLTYFMLRIAHLRPSNEMVYSQIATTHDVQTKELPDGSIVNLNKTSKIVYNSGFGKSNRDIILEGEAFFDVTRNKDLPFKIYCLNSTIEVLGTSFDVKVDTTQVLVGVITGKVALYESEDIRNRIELLPDHTGIYSSSGNELNVINGFDRNRIAWHTREFVFQNKPLQDVCEVLADYYHLELIKEKGILFSDSITFSCSTELDSVLFTINSSLTENIRLITKDNLLIVKKL